MRTARIALVLLASGMTALGQERERPVYADSVAMPASPVAHEDCTATFRLLAPNATKMKLVDGDPMGAIGGPAVTPGPTGAAGCRVDAV